MIKKLIYFVPQWTGIITFMIILLSFSFLTPCLGAEVYPERPITLVVPYAPGGTDRETRVVAPVMSKILGQPVLVENRTGGGGSIGTNSVIQSKPDGYTLLYAAGTVITLTPHISDLPYKFEDLIPIACTSYLPQMLSVGINTPWKTIQELVDYAKKNPGAIKFGSSGTGSAVHFCGEAFAFGANIKLTHVPFKGSAEALTAAIGGHIESVVTMPQTILSQVKGGTLRALVVFSSQRFPDLPEIPTIQEGGIPFEIEAGINWLGLFAPKGTPSSITNKLTETIQKVIADQETLNNFKKIGSLQEFRDQKDFKALLEKQSLMFKGLSEKMGLKKK